MTPRVLSSIYELTTADGHTAIYRSQWEVGYIAALRGAKSIAAIDIFVEDIANRRRPITADERESIAAYTWS